jgi:hypothetical protein
LAVFRGGACLCLFIHHESILEGISAKMTEGNSHRN